MAKRKKLRFKEVDSISSKEIKALLRFFPSDIRIIVETYQFACEAYEEIGLSYCWKELLSLPASSVYIPSSQGPCQMILNRTSSHGSLGEDFYARHVPEKLAKKLLLLSEKHRGGYLFQREDGSPFDQTSLNREFMLASEKALREKKIKRSISPLDLREAPTEVKYQPGVHREISAEQLEKIEKILKEHPSPKNAGSPRKYPLKDILKALLAQEDFKYSRKKLKELFSPSLALAAESQKRRWGKDSIWDQILKILQN